MTANSRCKTAWRARNPDIRERADDESESRVDSYT